MHQLPTVQNLLSRVIFMNKTLNRFDLILLLVPKTWSVN